MAYRVNVLGPPRLALRGTAIPLPASVHGLLGYLITKPDLAVDRGQLVGALWSECDELLARRRLSTALWRLNGEGRHALVRTVSPNLALALNDRALLWIDALAFERRVAPALRRPPADLTGCERNKLRRGLRLYRGPFLPLLDLEWAWIERQRLRNVYLDGLHAAAAAGVVHREWDEVLHWGRILAREEPLHEDVHRMLMQAYLEKDDRAAALAQYDLCRRVLQEELGVPPLPETQALRAKALLGSVPTRRSPGAVSDREEKTLRVRLSQSPIPRARAVEDLRRLQAVLGLSLREIELTLATMRQEGPEL